MIRAWPKEHNSRHLSCDQIIIWQRGIFVKYDQNWNPIVLHMKRAWALQELMIKKVFNIFNFSKQLQSYDSPCPFNKLHIDIVLVEDPNMPL